MTYPKTKLNAYKYWLPFQAINAITEGATRRNVLIFRLYSAYLITGTVQLVFSVRIVFFSHNNLAGTVFFSQFQPKFRPANGAS